MRSMPLTWLCIRCSAVCAAAAAAIAAARAQLYKLWTGDKFSLVLASTLNLDGTPDANEFNQSGEASLMDNYEYVMHGKVFKVASGGAAKDGKMEIFTSYGGLLMSLKGEPAHLAKIELDMRMYLLIKKVDA